MTDRNLVMNSQGSSNWIETLVAEATAQKWCMQTVCSTCGAMDFRTRLVRDAAVCAGVSIRGVRGAFRQPRLWELPDGLREECSHEIIGRLREVDEIFWINYCPEHFKHPLRVILMDLNDAAKLTDDEAWLDSQLDGSPAGGELRAMREHYAARGAET
jgi:hypothetical protein